MSFWWDREPDEIEKVFKISSGSRIYFRRQPPYGYWKVSFERGPVPSSLSGDYTHFQDLFNKTKQYLANRRYSAEIIEDVTNAP